MHHSYETIDHHVKTWCPLAIVECEYAYAGCEVMVSRIDMEEHVVATQFPRKYGRSNYAT